MRAIGKRSLASFLMVLITFGCWVTLFLLLLSTFLLMAAPWVDPPRIAVQLKVPTAFTITPEAHQVTGSAPGMESVHVEEARGSLILSPRNRVFVAGAALALIALLSLILWVLWQLRSLFHTLRAGQPFAAANATHIRRIGYSVIAGELVRVLLDYTGMRYAATHFFIQGLRLEARPDFNVIAIICGMIILVIAEVFREGTRLEEERSLTI